MSPDDGEGGEHEDDDHGGYCGGPAYHRSGFETQVLCKAWKFNVFTSEKRPLIFLTC